LVIEVRPGLRHGYAANHLSHDDHEDAECDEMKAVDAGVPFREEVRRYYGLGKGKGMSLPIPAAVGKKVGRDESAGRVVFSRDPEL